MANIGHAGWKGHCARVKTNPPRQIPHGWLYLFFVEMVFAGSSFPKVPKRSLVSQNTDLWKRSRCAVVPAG